MWTSSKRGGVNKNLLGDDNIIAKGATNRRNGLEKIKVEGDVDEGRKVIVRYETANLKWKGFESFMVLWPKVCEQI